MLKCFGGVLHLILLKWRYWSSQVKLSCEVGWPTYSWPSPIFSNTPWGASAHTVCSSLSILCVDRQTPTAKVGRLMSTVTTPVLLSPNILLFHTTTPAQGMTTNAAHCTTHSLRCACQATEWNTTAANVASSHCYSRSHIVPHHCTRLCLCSHITSEHCHQPPTTSHKNHLHPDSNKSGVTGEENWLFIQDTEGLLHCIGPNHWHTCEWPFPVGRTVS